MAEQYARITAPQLDTVFESLGVRLTPTARIWRSMLLRLRKDKERGCYTVRIGVKQLAREGFNGDTSNARRALKKLLNEGFLVILEKGHPIHDGQPAVTSLYMIPDYLLGGQSLE